MGKRPAEVERLEGNMGSIQREDAAFYAKRRIANHGNRTRTNSSESSERTKTPVYVLGPSHQAGEGLGESVSDSKDSAPGVDGQRVPEAKENFGDWIDAMLQSVQRQG